MSRNHKKQMMTAIKKMIWISIRSIEITCFILVVLPLIHLLYGKNQESHLKSLRILLGDDFSGAIIRSLALLLTLNLILVFIGTLAERKSYQKIRDGINHLAKGQYDTRLTYGRYDSLEYQELIEQFNTMAQELASTETLQHNFMNDVSHEFKTPIVSIKGFAKILKKKYILDEEGIEYLDIIIQESNRLSKLSENVLLLCKLEEQVLTREQSNYNLSEQLTRSVLILQKEWESKNMEIELDVEDITINGNEALLQQVWINLVNNAIKFSHEYGTIDLSLKEMEQHVKITIRDYGIGIEEVYLKEIFKRFYRVVTTQQNPGNGIGLSIVKRVIELHGGEVEVRSKVGEGTCFVVILPKEQK